MLKTFVILVRDETEPHLMTVYDVLPIDTSNPAHLTEQEIFAIAYSAPNFAEVRIEYPTE